MSEPISPNTTIAQYTIVSKIGEGLLLFEQMTFLS